MVLGIAIPINGANHQAVPPGGGSFQQIVVTDFGTDFDKLRKDIAQEILVFLMKAFPGQGIKTTQNIPRLGNRRLPPQMVLLLLYWRIIIGVRITHDRNKLVLQTQIEGFVGGGDRVERGRRMLQFVIRQLKGRHGMMTGGRTLEVERGASSKREHLEELGPIQLVDINAECRT